MAEYLTIKQVAKQYGVEEHQVRYAISTDKIVAMKVGWQWLIPKDKLPDKWPVHA